MSKVLVLDATYEDCADAVGKVFDSFPLDVRGKRVVVKVNALKAGDPETLPRNGLRGSVSPKASVIIFLTSRAKCVRLSHGGGTAPCIAGRWEHGYHQRTETKVKTDKPPSEYFKLLYFDSITHSDRALEFLVDTVGADQIIIGSDYPFDMGPADPVRSVERNVMISDADKAKILGGNAERLLKLA